MSGPSGRRKDVKFGPSFAHGDARQCRSPRTRMHKRAQIGAFRHIVKTPGWYAYRHRERMQTITFLRPECNGLTAMPSGPTLRDFSISSPSHQAQGAGTFPSQGRRPWNTAPQKTSQGLKGRPFRPSSDSIDPDPRAFGPGWQNGWPFGPQKDVNSGPAFAHGDARQCRSPRTRMHKRAQTWAFRHIVKTPGSYAYRHRERIQTITFIRPGCMGLTAMPSGPTLRDLPISSPSHQARRAGTFPSQGRRPWNTAP